MIETQFFKWHCQVSRDDSEPYTVSMTYTLKLAERVIFSLTCFSNSAMKVGAILDAIESEAKSGGIEFISWHKMVYHETST